MENLEGLQFQIEVMSDNTDQKLDNLASAFERLKSATSGWNGTSTVNRLSALKDAVQGLDGNAVSGLEKLASVLSTLNGLGSISISTTIPKRISDIAAAAAQITEDSISRLERMGEAIQKLGSAGSIPKINLGSSGVGTPSGTNTTTVAHDMEDAAEATERMSSSAASSGTSFGTVYSIITNIIDTLEHAGSTIERVSILGMKYSGMLGTMLASGLIQRIKEATSSFTHMFSALKRIAMYRLFRTVIKEITQGLREGINNIYEWSRALSGEFAAAMDSLASSSLYLKNSLGALAAPIIQALIPAINFAIDRIVALMNILNQLISALGGKATFTAAKKMETSFAKAAGGAAGAAKKAVDKIKSYTIGIDELNILEDNKNNAGGGGGGGGGGGLNYADMFETLDIDKSVSDFAKSLRSAFERRNWKELGQILGNKFNEIVNGIQWDSLGQKFGGGIQGIIGTAYHFLRTADFNELGRGFATFLNNTLSSINFQELGGLLVRRITSLIDLAIGFLQGLDPQVVGKTISDYLIGVYQEAAEWLDSVDWQQVAFDITNLIVGILAAIDWPKLISSLAKFVWELLKFAWDISWGAFINKILPQSVENFKKVFGEKIESAGNTFKETLQTMFTWEFHVNLANDAINWAAELLEYWGKATLIVGKKALEFAVYVANNAPQWASDLIAFWGKALVFVAKKGLEFTVSLANTAIDWASSLLLYWANVLTILKDKVPEFTANLKNDALRWFTDLKSWWKSQATEPVGTFITTVKNDAAKWWRDVKSWWNGEISTLELAVAIKNQASTWWSNVKSWWEKAVGTLTAKLNIKIPKIEVEWVNKVLGAYSIKVPQFKVNWNAKGAILEGAQIFGAIGERLLGGGEAGREAVLPLEQNTGWMDTIAEKVRDTMLNASAFEYAGVDRILERLDSIEARLMSVDDNTRVQAEKPGNTYVTIGGKAVRDAVIRQGKADGFSFA